jgi:hypothetical protein
MGIASGFILPLLVEIQLLDIAGAGSVGSISELI